ncbi:MAG: HesA/MoeB/ThiF family protein [Candidatus Aureabacteria bacterium]|nr:HesA/MoeB/ThiF family protein [Candidatus Auribacterota bacterium]
MKNDLIRKLEALAESYKAPSGDEYRGISLKVVEAVSAEAGASRRDVEIAALEAGIIPLRYQRNIGSIGIEGQLKLRKARVAVIGAGGLGGTLIELLSRMGIGELLVIDSDSFSEDNLNRQILCTEQDIGRSKVEAARRRIVSINSAVDMDARQVVVSGDNVDALIKGCDLVIDALDTIPVRLLVQEAARRLRIPLIHGAIAGFLGEVMTIFPGDRGLEALFGGGGNAPEKGIEVQVGTPTVTPMAIAALQAMEAIKVLLGMMGPIRHRLLYLDLEQDVLSGVRIANADTK